MTETSASQMLIQILDELPDAVTYMVPVFREDETDDILPMPIDFIFVYANEKAIKLGSLPREIVDTVTILSSNHSLTENRQQLFEQLRSVYTTGIAQEFSYMHPVDNTTVDVLRTKFREGVLSISRDRAGLQKAERELVKKNELLEHSISELQRSNESLERYAYVASHDLQEPLRKIISYSELLERRHSNVITEDARLLIQKMADAGRRMDQLVKDLLLHSRLSDEPRAFEKINLNEIVADVISDLETSIEQNSAKVSYGQLHPVLGSKLQMRQLFQNLISNSLKFIHPGKQPEIKIEAELVTGKESGLDLPRKYFPALFQHISFSDNGIGFDQSDAEKIFQIFRRLHGRNYPGSGIGLSIVRKVIEHHNGFITAEGEPGKGATFHILLPVT